MDDSHRAFSDVVGLVKTWMPWRSEPAHISTDFWIPDESCIACYECDSNFTFFNRRHHCRLCGRIFCANCSSNWLPIEHDMDSNTIRVCNYCFKQPQVSNSLSKSLSHNSLDSEESQQVAGEDAENDIVDEWEKPSSLNEIDADTESFDIENLGVLWIPPEPEDMLEDDGDEIESLPLISSSVGDIQRSSLNQSSTETKPIEVDKVDVAGDISTSSHFGDSTVESDCCNVDANKNLSNPTSMQTDGLKTHDEQPALTEEFPPPPSHNQSIKYYYSSRCVRKAAVCVSPRLLEAKYYGSSDMPFGRALHDNLLNQKFLCNSCEMPTEAHVLCYTHRQGTLIVSLRKLDCKTPLPGEGDGEIWMWQRCLRCPRVNGYPPATRRVLMSDAAWGLSFGRFLELSSSNDAAASRVASCCHSPHRDCLRFYGVGQMVACFRYAPIEVYSVCVPPAKLDFTYESQKWIEKEIKEVVVRADLLFSEVLNALHLLAERTCGLSMMNSGIKVPGSRRQHLITNLEGLLHKEKSIFEESLQNILKKEAKIGQHLIDILELNRLLRELAFQSYVWDLRLRNTAGIGVPKKCSESEFSEADTSSIVFDKVDNEEDIEDSTSVSPTKSSGDVEDTENWLTTPISVYYQSSNKNYSGPDLKLDILCGYNPIYISSFQDPELPGGVRLLLPVGVNDTVIPVYDDEPSSLISYALVSHEYFGQLSDEPFRPKDIADSTSSFHSTDCMSSVHSLDTKPLHARVSFTDGKVRCTVTCYHAKHFEVLRSFYCPTEVDFVRSLSRCKKWAAPGGDGNVFFAKTLDDRFIIKQMTKTKLQSFMKFAPDYFKYISESIGTTCMSKILGIYQVSSKHLKGGKETKMDMLVMENLLFGRNITRLYDLKGSSRSRYNPDSSGSNKVLLDQNLIEAMVTSPIFVGNKDKRFERAIWNDTWFLASIDVMDYSLLMGVDEENEELVVGIIDFMRQYTWDKQLESWVKAWGGPKNASPTVISPKEYKKRFRKAMSMYFLRIPDQ